MKQRRKETGELTTLDVRPTLDETILDNVDQRACWGLRTIGSWWPSTQPISPLLAQPPARMDRRTAESIRLRSRATTWADGHARVPACAPTYSPAH